MNFKTIKRKMLSLVERIRLSENEYNELKGKSEMLDNIMSTFKFEINTEHTDAKDKHGNIIRRCLKSRKATITVDVEQMLKNLGISWSGGDCEVKIINCKEG
ncbi:MAG: hypothetical protein II304_07875 [Bacteroidales bacterium]|nr:hypothetical protein [Bacteroidales bacterium]